MAMENNVAKHYNELQEGGIETRTKSRIFYLRNLNNWIKAMTIQEFLAKLRERRGRDAHISVLDLCSGKGGDFRKWKIGRVKKVVAADIAEVSLQQAEARYKQQRLGFDVEFIAADCSKVRLKERYADPGQQFQLVSCQFSFHYSFASHAQADTMLRNAAECLEPGGYFIGTTPNANEIIKRLRASPDGSFGNDVYRVSCACADNPPLFGAKYNFFLEGVVDCPEYLVHFPLLEKMAARYGLQLVKKMTFAAFISEQLRSCEGRGLMGRMQALETYPPEDGVDLVGSEGSYDAARATVQRLTEQQGRGRACVGTLSKEEWEATTIYLVFAFKRLQDKAPPYVPPPATAQPAADDTAQPAAEDTALPAADDTAQPAADDTAQPAADDTALPAAEDTALPAAEDTALPAAEDTALPAAEDTAQPAADDTAQPAADDTAQPAADDTAQPAADDTALPAAEDTALPAAEDTALPAAEDTALPAAEDTAQAVPPAETDQTAAQEAAQRVPTAD